MQRYDIGRVWCYPHATVPILFEVCPPQLQAGPLLQGDEDASRLRLASYGSDAVSDPSTVSLRGEGIWRKVTSQWYSSMATAQWWAGFFL